MSVRMIAVVLFAMMSAGCWYEMKPDGRIWACDHYTMPHSGETTVVCQDTGYRWGR
jgi:hypothetical protein